VVVSPVRAGRRPPEAPGNWRPEWWGRAMGRCGADSPLAVAQAAAANLGRRTVSAVRTEEHCQASPVKAGNHSGRYFAGPAQSFGLKHSRQGLRSGKRTVDPANSPTPAKPESSLKWPETPPTAHHIRRTSCNRLRIADAPPSFTTGCWACGRRTGCRSPLPPAS
jgi:hypothetical protein